MKPFKHKNYGWQGDTGKRRAFTKNDIKKLLPVAELECPQLGLDKPYLGKEAQFQKATQAFLAHYDMFNKSAYHIPNERKGDGTRIQLSLQGVKPGVADWCIAIPFECDGKIYHGMYLELKVHKGEVSQEQIEFLNTQFRLNYFCAVIWNLEVFEQVIKWAYFHQK